MIILASLYMQVRCVDDFMEALFSSLLYYDRYLWDVNVVQQIVSIVLVLLDGNNTAVPTGNSNLMMESIGVSSDHTVLNHSKPDDVQDIAKPNTLHAFAFGAVSELLKYEIYFISLFFFPVFSCYFTT
jgi:hypothetical protein